MKNIDKENISLKTYLKAFLALLFFPMKVLLPMIPRNKKIWLFGVAVGQRYADNSRALFEWIHNNNISDIQAIWITKNKKIKEEVVKKGFPCYLAYEPKGIYYTVLGYVYIYCSTTSDINHWTSYGAFKVNLWHGTPIKKIGFDNEMESDRDFKIKKSKGLKRFFYRLIYPGFFEKPDLFCTASDYISERIQKAWRLKKHVMTVTGYPRNDILFTPTLLEGGSLPIKIINNFFKENKTIITYLPTYRERTNKQFDIDWEKLQSLLIKHNAIFVIKLHPFDKTTIDVSQYDNIVFLNSAIDIYPLLAISDGLLTDYSSVVFDFMILDRPIIFYAFDLDEYISKDRELYAPFEDIAGGTIATSSDQLMLLKAKYFYQRTE